MPQSAVGMNMELYRRSLATSRILTAGSSATAVLALASLVVLIAFGSSQGSISLIGLFFAAGLGGLIAGLGVAFPTIKHFRRARPSVSDEGIVPRRWSVGDLIKRRQVVPWSEIEKIRVARGHGWTAYVWLRNGTYRLVWNEKGVPDEFVEACRQYALSKGVPFEEAPPRDKTGRRSG